MAWLGLFILGKSKIYENTKTLRIHNWVWWIGLRNVNMEMKMTVSLILQTGLFSDGRERLVCKCCTENGSVFCYLMFTFCFYYNNMQNCSIGLHFFDLLVLLLWESRGSNRAKLKCLLSQQSLCMWGGNCSAKLGHIHPKSHMNAG